jgi:hypothetical protein
MRISCLSEQAEFLSQILQNQYPMKNGEHEPSKLSSSCSRMPPHVHLDHSDEQPEERPVTQKQQDEQTKSDQLKSEQPRQ